jgi:ATP-dependent DNA ligase
VLDGELVIPIDGEVSFDALQMRLHPAQSRSSRLAEETPATLILFDCLLTNLGGRCSPGPSRNAAKRSKGSFVGSAARAMVSL